MSTEMVIQRLTIRAATGKLRIIPVWRCLAQSGAKVVRWNVHADRNDGMDSMTVDIIEADPLRTEEIAIALGKGPLEMTVTALNLTVLSTPNSAPDVGAESERTAADARRIDRPPARPTILRNVTSQIPPVAKD
ncbi:hypothetical protein M3I53_20980 [Paraburkholderia sp. CNPSo 3272]|uniref:hypothetical protein n=1 Tax=Paraburkholderia sp. CNPSo 3272 TaxID=2940931 RepID=UPI0020B6542F|nr:hypothetical protein [Paraburkholderia sp. CNPSo 3272]MCP3725569.1 hypothetical protein [Paraburkholderia sp. CNPSo 3272]